MNKSASTASADCQKFSCTLPAAMVDAIDARADDPARAYHGNRSAVLRDILAREFGLKRVAKSVREGRPANAK